MGKHCFLRTESKSPTVRAPLPLSSRVPPSLTPTHPATHPLQVRPALEARGDDISGIDFDYVLWTDPDVLFMQDIDGCSLPRPRLVSIGPEVCASSSFLLSFILCSPDAQ